MKEVINAAQSRRGFIQLAAAAAASAISARVLRAEQQEQTEAPSYSAAGMATFEDVWQTVRDRFYDRHLQGLDWAAVRDRYLPGVERATSEEELAVLINRMLSELRASHTAYYTPYQPEYYQLADIFAGALRRRGLERAFPGGRISYPGIGVLSRADRQDLNLIAGVVDGTPAQRAGLLAGDRIISVGGAPYQPVRSFRGKIGKPVVWRCAVRKP